MLWEACWHTQPIPSTLFTNGFNIFFYFFSFRRKHKMPICTFFSFSLSYFWVWCLYIVIINRIEILVSHTMRLHHCAHFLHTWTRTLLCQLCKCRSPFFVTFVAIDGLFWYVLLTSLSFFPFFDAQSVIVVDWIEQNTILKSIEWREAVLNFVQPNWFKIHENVSLPRKRVTEKINE